MPNMRATVNIRLVFTDHDDESCVEIMHELLNSGVAADVRAKLGDVIEYFVGTEGEGYNVHMDLCEVDVNHTVVNAPKEIAA